MPIQIAAADAPRAAISFCSASIALASSLPVSGERSRRKTYRRHKRQVRPRARHRISFLEIVVWLTCAATATYALRQNIEWPGRNETPRRSRQLTMDEAREYNASVPFVAGSLQLAKPFVFHGSPAAKLQATECLATAALYEAGTDERGQRAVIQVVLNRVRHPGFPRTVCGVVYQGSSRRTGCQFTFTCDGSFQRRRARAGWVQARKAAKRALGGYVFADVGTATHYHADWVVPYWRGALAKIAQVDTHIFYR